MAIFSSTQPSLRARVLPRFPANVIAGSGITITRNGLDYTFTATSERELLTEDRTYYVRTDGNNSNDGLSDTASGAFASFSAAVQALNRIDGNNFNVTIQGNNATHTDIIKFDVDLLGVNSLFIDCAGGTIHTDGNCLTISGGTLGGIYLSNMTLISDNGNTIVLFDTPYLELDAGVIFGACPNGSHISVQSYACVVNHAGYTISGGAQVHIDTGDFAGGGASFGWFAGVTVTGTPNFTVAFIRISDNCSFNGWDSSFTGAATGTRFIVKNGGIIDPGIGNQSNLTYFPGSVAGTIDYAGVYGDIVQAKYITFGVDPAGTVAQLLPANTSGFTGTRSFVTDATATTFGSIVAGGGANKVPVYSDGTNWRIG